VCSCCSPELSGILRTTITSPMTSGPIRIRTRTICIPQMTQPGYPFPTCHSQRVTHISLPIHFYFGPGPFIRPQALLPGACAAIASALPLIVNAHQRFAWCFVSAISPFVIVSQCLIFILHCCISCISCLCSHLVCTHVRENDIYYIYNVSTMCIIYFPALRVQKKACSAIVSPPCTLPSWKHSREFQWTPGCRCDQDQAHICTQLPPMLPVTRLSTSRSADHLDPNCNDSALHGSPAAGEWDGGYPNIVVFQIW
jgi:hypothetical protein